jgi:hypothetical protein
MSFNQSYRWFELWLVVQEGRRAIPAPLIAFSALFHCARLHIQQFPNVAVQVLIPVRVHKTMVLWFIVGRAASGDSLTHQLVNLCAALAVQSDQHLGAFGRVTDLFGRECFELIVRQQHRKDVFTDDHARSGLVSKLLVERVTEFGKKLDGLFQIFDRQVYENFGSHNFSFLKVDCVMKRQ